LRWSSTMSSSVMTRVIPSITWALRRTSRGRLFTIFVETNWISSGERRLVFSRREL
jgi:hypothetical protein